MAPDPGVAAAAMQSVRRCAGRPIALPAAIGALALMLRLCGLGDKPFWLDEVASLHRATSSVPDLVADSMHANHYPSYFLLLWLIARIGVSQWLLRLPSAICGAVATALACTIGRRVGGSRSGAIAGLLLAFSPFEVQLGQEARSYTLVSCLILVALWGLVRLAQDPPAAALPLLRTGEARRAWAAYGLGTAAALGVLNVAVAWLFAANLGALGIASRGGPATRGFARNWLLAQCLILAAWLPSAAAVYIVGHGTILDGTRWAPVETPAAIWSTLAPVYLMRISTFITPDLFPAALPGLSFAIPALVCLGAWQLRRDPRLVWVLGCAALAPPFALLLVSLFVPALAPRYLAWSAAPFFILAGAGLGRIAPAPFAALMPALGLGCLVNLLPYYDCETKPRWDLLAAKLAADARPGDVVLLNSYYSYLVLAVFVSRSGLADRPVRLTWLSGEAARLAAGHDLWVAYGRAGQRINQAPDEYLQSIGVLGLPIAEAAIGRYIRVWRFSIAPVQDKADLSTSPRLRRLGDS